MRTGCTLSSPRRIAISGMTSSIILTATFGTLGNFDELLDRAYALGLKVLIDQVWSQPSGRHP